MGALAPVTPWIPEDDLLLKNAVEAGASLESLAKGAVQFSRRFTIRELRDRWQSLLYDPDISADASSRLVQLELSASNLSPQSSILGNSKGNGVPGKRKGESVRSHYYAMRKRICNEPFSSVDLSFLNTPNLHNCTGDGGGCEGQLTIHNEHPVGNCILGDPITNHFELQDMDFDILHDGFPQVARNDTAVGSYGVADNAFHTGHRDSLGGDIPDEMVGRGCMYGFAENVSPVSVNEPVGNDDVGHSFENDDVHKDNHHILGENMSVIGSKGVHEMGPSQALPVVNLFETDDLKKKPLAVFDAINNNPGNVSSGFGGSQGFSSPVSDCCAPFHQLGYSSPIPTMSIWRTLEDISTPAIPIDENPGGQDKSAGDTLALPADDAKKMSFSGYDVVHSEPQLKDGVSGDGLCSSTISEGDYLDMSNSLLNFANEEVLLFMDDEIHGKDIMGRSCLDGLNSILLSSPNDVHQDDRPSTSEPNKASVALDACLMFPDVPPCSGELDAIDDKLHSDRKACDSEINVPSSTSAPNPHSPELQNGVICCMLNTEDPEIPCNDDVFSSIQVLPLCISSNMQPNSVDASNSVPPSTKDFSDDQKASEHGLNLVKDEGGELLIASRVMESHMLAEMCSNNPVKICGVKSELPEISVPIIPHSFPAGIRKNDIMKVEMGKQCDFDNSIDMLIEKPVHGSDHIKNHPQIVVDGCKRAADALVAIQNHASTLAAPCSTEMALPEPAVNPSTSDHEELLSENEDGVPYFSEIEAMILDMELDPFDHDSYFSREVSRNRQEDNTKRAIMRLEQGAHSFMQRAIAHHRAFAILYGRHLKYYIKKPEVLLGRATDDVNVDIDLAREGHANKISRRQAIIKMEEDGSFCLKNLGKCSILVNSKEVASGQHVKLSSSCLIEMRGMRFLFETNQNFVTQYLANKSKKNQDMSSKFEWSPNGVR